MPIIGASQGKVPQTKKRETILNLVDLADMPGGGYTIGACGFKNTGKTDSLLTMGYMNMNLAHKYKDKYPTLFSNLHDGTVPEVERIIVIESENAIGKQMKRKYETKLLAPMRKYVDVKVISVPVVSYEEMRAATGEFIPNPEKVEDILTASDIYMESLKMVLNDYGDETMVMLDSASRFKLLLDTKAQVIYNQKIAKLGPTAMKEEGYNKWGSRNIWWDAAMTMLRGAPGWCGVTFMVQDNPNWVAEAQKKKGRTPEYTKTIWTDRTAHNFDMIYDFEFNEDRSIRVDTRLGRYMGRGAEGEELNSFKLHQFERTSFLQAIENMLYVIEGDEFDDWED